MTETVNACLLCGKDRFATFDRRKFRGYEVTNVLCTHCGLVIQSPRMDADELGKYYQEQYRIAYQGQEGPGKRDLLIQAARAKNLVRFLKELGIVGISRYADIGSSAGLLMEVIQNSYHCQVVGVEPGDAYRQHAQSRGFEVYKNLEEIDAGEDNKFNLVSMIHVLEHLPDPVEYLRNLRKKYLTTDGYLLIEVPNLYAHDCFEVAHLTSFSRETLSQVLKKAGYETVYIEMHGTPLSRLIPLYITVLSRPSEDLDSSENINFEKLVGMKRRAGFLHRWVIERVLPNYGWVPEFRS